MFEFLIYLNYAYILIAPLITMILAVLAYRNAKEAKKLSLKIWRKMNGVEPDEHLKEGP